MYQDWSFKIGGEVENSKNRQFHIRKYGLRRTHDVVESTDYLILLITRKTLWKFIPVAIPKSDFTEIT